MGNPAAFTGPLLWGVASIVLFSQFSWVVQNKTHTNCQLKYAILLYSEFFVEGNQEEHLYLNLESENDVRF